MKLTLDPMPLLRADAEQKINAHFNGLANLSTQQDQEHQLKRDEAAAVAAGGEPSAGFAAAAALENVTARALAETILTKPNEVWERANRRRATILAARAASNPSQISEILASLTM